MIDVERDLRGDVLGLAFGIDCAVRWRAPPSKSTKSHLRVMNSESRQPVKIWLRVAVVFFCLCFGTRPGGWAIQTFKEETFGGADRSGEIPRRPTRRGGPASYRLDLVICGMWCKGLKVFELLLSARRKWRSLDGSNHLRPGHSGSEVQGPDQANQTRRLISPSPTFGHSSGEEGLRSPQSVNTRCPVVVD